MSNSTGSSAENKINNDLEKKKLENASGIDIDEPEEPQKCSDRDNLTHELSVDKEVEHGTVEQIISNNFSSKHSGMEQDTTQYVRKIQAASVCQEEKCSCRTKYAYHEVYKQNKLFHCG